MLQKYFQSDSCQRILQRWAARVVVVTLSCCGACCVIAQLRSSNPSNTTARSARRGCESAWYSRSRAECFAIRQIALFERNGYASESVPSLLQLRFACGRECARLDNAVVCEEFQRIVVIAYAIVIDITNAAFADSVCAEFVKRRAQLQEEILLAIGFDADGYNINVTNFDQSAIFEASYSSTAWLKQDIPLWSDGQCVLMHEATGEATFSISPLFSRNSTGS